MSAPGSGAPAAAPSALLLVDGPNLVMRAAFGGNDSTPAGVARAVAGATGLLARAILAANPTHVIVAFDCPGPSWRRAHWPAYKQHRSADTLPFCLAFEAALAARGFYCECVGEFEADDVIATRAVRARARGTAVAVASGDSDLLALTAPELGGARALVPEKGGAWRAYNAGDAAAKYGLRHARQLTDYKALRGESGDFGPGFGVRGIGEKYAAALLQAYDDLDAVLGANHLQLADRKLAKLVALVQGQSAAALLARHLIALRTDAPLRPVAPARCALGNPGGEQQEGRAA